MDLSKQGLGLVRGSVHMRRKSSYSTQAAVVWNFRWRPGEQHGHLRVCRRRFDRQVVTVVLGVQPGEVWIVDHQVGRLGQRTIALVAADAALDWSPRSSAVDDAVPACT